ncbi:MAG: hypothetical protein AB7G28_00725 [Pirellulales bacterium]
MDRPLWLYMALAFGISWGAGVALFTGGMRAGGGHPFHPLHYLAVFGPSIAGLIMAARVGGRAGVGRMMARLVPTAAGLPWYGVVLVPFPAANFAAAWLFAPESLLQLPLPSMEGTYAEYF